MPKNRSQYKGFEDWIQIFETGAHTDSSGHTRTWSQQDLRSLIANHDPEHPAPLVVGHPASDDPRYGQVAEYKLDEAGRLWFKGTDIEPSFEQMVAEQRFPERSIAIDSDGKGGFKVRHIGFLGAVPPALQLTPMQYGHDTPAAHTYAFALLSACHAQAVDARTPRLLGRILGHLREFLIDRFDLDTADKVLPHWDVDALKEQAAELANNDQTPSAYASSHADRPHFSQTTGENPMPETHTFSQADIDAAVAAATEKQQAAFNQDKAHLKAELDQARREYLSAEYQAQVDKAITEGRLTPAQSEGLVEFMLALPGDAQAPFTFFTRGEGAKKESVKQTPMQFFEGFIGKLGKQIDLNSEQGGADSASDSAATATFALADHKAQVDAERLALHNRALDYQKQHPDTPYIAAVAAVGG